ncbi:hypothetical protein [Thermococcus peptonophilus]|uniref:hypothetical protein n=1 Tax=Thermococcus peptonophilus TaxID=53952 RepID=UPI0034676A5B
MKATFSNITIDWGVYYLYMLREKELTTIANLNLTIYFDGNVTNGTYRFGFLPERYFDINFDHNYDEVYFVLYTPPDGRVYFYPIPLQLNTTNANTLNAVYFTGKYNPHYRRTNLCCKRDPPRSNNGHPRRHELYLHRQPEHGL